VFRHTLSFADVRPTVEEPSHVEKEREVAAAIRSSQLPMIVAIIGRDVARTASLHSFGSATPRVSHPRALFPDV
jgi:hypothetical protein